MDDVLSPKNVHEGVLLPNGATDKHLVGVSDCLGMAFLALELRDARDAGGVPSRAVRDPGLHVLCVQHDRSVFLNDKLTHHVGDLLGEDLQSKQRRQLVDLEVVDEIPEEGRVDTIQVGDGTFSVFVGLQLAVAGQGKNVAVDVGGPDAGNLCRLGPASVDRGQGRAQHDGTFLQLQMSVNKMDSKLVLNVIQLQEVGQSLEMALFHLGLVTIVGEAVVSVAVISIGSTLIVGCRIAHAMVDAFRFSMVGGIFRPGTEMGVWIATAMMNEEARCGTGATGVWSTWTRDGGMSSKTVVRCGGRQCLRAKNK